ncbi:Hypothetical predicted protein [Octopus vulgaris]|uniref:Uncharacterized protein n=1 Tax=Octopus vulgaris TaxID=6645 RepID=A0AA36FL02_OCTVU|nr:Hypothetical predicted protein [Octopus vulgaris]
MLNIWSASTIPEETLAIIYTHLAEPAPNVRRTLVDVPRDYVTILVLTLTRTAKCGQIWENATTTQII